MGLDASLWDTGIARRGARYLRMVRDGRTVEVRSVRMEEMKTSIFQRKFGPTCPGCSGEWSLEILHPSVM